MRIVLENRFADRMQRGWVTVGLPQPLNDSGDAISCTVSDARRKFAAVAIGRELFVDATLEARERAHFVVQPSGGALEPFQLHPAVADEPEKLMPSYRVFGLDGKLVGISDPTPFWDGSGPMPSAFIQPLSMIGPRWRWMLRTRIAAVPLMIEGWFDIWIWQKNVDFRLRLSYGSTAGGQVLRAVLGSVSMLVGEEPLIDWRVRKGLHVPMWRQDLHCWEAEVATPQEWLRCTTVEVFGALLCRPAKPNTDSESDNQAARRQGPLCGLAHRSEWQGKFGPFAVPELWPGAFDEQARRAGSMQTRYQTPSSEREARPYAQPPNSGQTGEQPDFGWTRAEHAVAVGEPWALHDLRYSVQAWLLRPYANREPDGSPVMASKHPGAALYNLRPDARFGTDHLGWPLPVPYIGSWDTSDSQHRSDNLLYGLFRLTRDPSLERTIRDMIELEKMELRRPDPAPGSGVGSPRGWGRPLAAHLWGLHCGFNEFEPMIRDTIRRMSIAAAFRRLPADGVDRVRVLSDNESKYGWVNPDGTSIRAWLPWQEAICVVPLYAAWNMLGIQEARELALTVARTICRHAFFLAEDGNWHYCYAVRWRTDAEGEPLPASVYTLSKPNYDVFVTGDTQRWALPALRVLLALDPQADSPDRQRAAEILSHFAAKNWDDACWWAVS